MKDVVSSLALAFSALCCGFVMAGCIYDRKKSDPPPLPPPVVEEIRTR